MKFKELCNVILQGVSNKTPIYVMCGGKQMQFPNRKEAKAFFKQGMNSCDGSESERYASIYYKLDAGLNYVDDSWDDVEKPELFK